MYVSSAFFVLVVIFLRLGIIGREPTWTLSLKSLSKASAEILGTDAIVSARNLPIELSGSIRPSWNCQQAVVLACQRQAFEVANFEHDGLIKLLVVSNDNFTSSADVFQRLCNRRWSMTTEWWIEILYHNIIHISEDSVNHNLQPLDSWFQAFEIVWQPLHYWLLQDIDCKRSRV